MTLGSFHIDWLHFPSTGVLFQVLVLILWKQMLEKASAFTFLERGARTCH